MYQNLTNQFPIDGHLYSLHIWYFKQCYKVNLSYGCENIQGPKVKLAGQNKYVFRFVGSPEMLSEDILPIFPPTNSR